MKVRTELSDCEEIVIRCRERDEKIRALELAIEEALRGESTLILLSGDTEYFIKKANILYFESSGGRVYAHTVDRIYIAPYKLFELEDLMPSCFVRVSKSAIANVAKAASLHRELVGNGVLTFRSSEKSVWFSRSYYRLLQYKIDELMK